jgi:hypothetical protein
MSTKHYILVGLQLVMSCLAYSQVATEIQSARVYDLSVIQVFPDSFPQVEVVFLARDQSGRPLWDVRENDLTVMEDGIPCDLIDLTNIGAKDVIDIALVFDHSGSMGDPIVPDSMINYIWSREEIDSLMRLPRPIDYAKDGVLSFISSGSLQSDSILITGFSSYTDSIIGPTQDPKLLEDKVNAMVANEGTAFYDAIIETLGHLSNENGKKSAIVALTDGRDNSSINTVNDVLAMSTLMEVPIYIIGLGYVQDSTLSVIADSTKGLYYKTDDPKKLEEIYMNISRQLKSVYKLTYKSQITGFESNEHQISFGFANDTLSFSNPDIRLTLPQEVLSYLEEQEQIRIKEERNRNLIIGGVGAGVLAVGLTTFLLFRRRTKQRYFKIEKLYPNPFQNLLNISIESSSDSEVYDVRIIDLKGFTVFQSQLTDKMTAIDLSHIPAGAYIVQVFSADGISDKQKVVKG